MNTTIIKKNINHICKFVKCNAPTILSGLSVIGVVSTSITVGLATQKSMKRLDNLNKEDKASKPKVILAVVPPFIPAFLMGGSTIACILGANMLNQKTQASLIGAYMLADNSFKDYRKKLIELHGDEMDQEIRGEIAREHCNYHVLGLENPDKKVLWYEPYSETYFELYEREVMDAEYHTNRNFIMAGSITFNGFLEMLGLPSMPNGDEIGWCICDGYMWIDFEHELMHKPDGTPYYMVQSIFPPSTEEELEECGYGLYGGF